MSTYKTIEYSKERDLVKINLNRPDVRNAFNDIMIKELHNVFDQIKESATAKALLIKGNGSLFSAGADLNWMKNMVDNSYDENYRDI